jgi:hypothetical protein
MYKYLADVQLFYNMLMIVIFLQTYLFTYNEFVFIHSETFTFIGTFTLSGTFKFNGNLTCRGSILAVESFIRQYDLKLIHTVSLFTNILQILLSQKIVTHLGRVQT